MEMTTKQKLELSAKMAAAAAAEKESEAKALKMRQWDHAVVEIVNEIVRKSDLITSRYIRNEYNGINVKFYEAEKCFYEILVLEYTGKTWDLNVAKGYKADADTIWNLFHKLASERGL